MVKIDTLFKEDKISRISDLEVQRYLNFFENSWRDNFEHSKKNAEEFPRWSIISGYYAMHDITKLLLAKKFRLKVEFEVHATTISLFRELVKNNELPALLEKGYREFLMLANDLEEAKKERTKAQYYTGTAFLKEEYKKKAVEFLNKVVLNYLKKLRALLK